MNFSIEAHQAIDWTTRLVAVYALLDTTEKLSSFKEFKGDGFYSWEFLREHVSFSSRSNKTRKLLDLFFEFRSWLFLLCLRGVCAFWLLCFLQRQKTIDVFCLAVLFAFGSLANLRNTPFGAETENRFSLMIIGALFLQSVAPTELVTKVSLWFIALQSCLSYLTAGVVKLINKEWHGIGLFNVVNSPNLVASQTPAIFIEKHQTIARLLTWLTMTVECAFPLVLLVGKPWFVFFLAWGAMFHIANAILLRFNKFFWVWIATYPAIIFAAQ